jgi:DNA polymerase-3 subunit gamma/tau
MLTKEAFNALLKTLEEPPPHVKFIFATTEAQKIPVTILSRCQRFDFAGIGTMRIVERLRQVVVDEKMQADDEALELIARRAGGSMRDAQSLLDQLLAFGEDRLTADHVYRLLGTAHVDRVMELAKAILERDSKEALELLGQSVDEGLQQGEILDQLIEFWRDLMVVNCGGADIGDFSVPSRHREALTRQAKAISLDTVLAGLDVLSAAKSRMRGSNHGRVLLEMALVRLSRLDDLVSLSQLTQLLNPSDGRGSKIVDGGSRIEDRGSTIENRVSKLEGQKTKNETGHLKAENHNIVNIEIPSNLGQAGDSGALNSPSSFLEHRISPLQKELTEASLPEIWPAILGELGPMLAGNLGKAQAVAISGPKTLVLRFLPSYNHERDYCQESTRLIRIQDAIQKITGQSWSLRVESSGGQEVGPQLKVQAADSGTSNYRRQRAEAGQEPLVRRAIDQLSAQIVHVEEGFGATKLEPPETLETANVEEA